MKSIISKGLMVQEEQFFIAGLVKEYSPRKVLEVGVASGASSIILLDALKNDGKLYSHDYSSIDYSSNKPTGYLLNEVPKLKLNWTLKTGGMCCRYLDDFCADGELFDLCFLDTSHANPGEFLDFLQILPYMKKGSILVLHDISLHTKYTHKNYQTSCILYSAIKGRQILPKGDFFVNIGAVILDDDIMHNVYDIFNLLRLPWQYNISKQDINDIKKSFTKHYSLEMNKLFDSFCNFTPKKTESNTETIRKFLRALKNNLWI